MNILFLSLYNYEKNTRDIYADLLKEIKERGHKIHIICPIERRLKQKTRLETINEMKVLKVKMLNIRKVNKLEKGIATLSIEYIFKKGIKKYFSDIKFDLVIYTTPPITFSKVINYVKARDNAKSYLLLKDIFPQNAVDLRMIKKGGVLYKFFRNKEIQLYKNADFIGCMSDGNIQYLLKENRYIPREKVELLPNSIVPNEYGDINLELEMKLRTKYGLPKDRLISAYGGNLGKPQGIDFLIEIIEDNKKNENIFFFIAGMGTEFDKLKEAIDKNQIKNVKLVKHLSKEEYENVLRLCDIGLIFLDKNFTIPNIPSRLLSYMDMSMPIIAGTDRNTDLGEILEENQIGYWCESGELEKFNLILNKFVLDKKLITKMGESSRRILEEKYTAAKGAEDILKHFCK